MTDRTSPARAPRASTIERLQASLDRSEYHLSTLQEVSRELARAGDEAAIFRIALSTMMGALGAASGLALIFGIR